MDIVRNRLRQAPLDFLSAVSNSTLDGFQAEWHSLCEDVDKASDLLMSDEDLSLIHATASQLATLSDSLLQTEVETVKKTARFMDEVENVFSRLTLSDIIAPPSSTHTAFHRVRRSSSGTPSYLSAAYTWMLHNIHDPYPSSETKERISRDAGRPLRVITDWFKETRRYIGWVALCKDHFQGSRALAVQAAKQVYLHTYPASQLPPSPAIVSQFEAIRTRLGDMYPMAYDDDDLSDGTDDSFTPSPLASLQSTYSQSLYARSRSHSSSSTPSLVFSTDDEDNHSLASFTLDDAPAKLGKRKNIEGGQIRPLKRNRSGFISISDESATDIVSVSPPASVTLERCLSPDQSPSSPSIPSRKRRLSIAATEWEDTTSPSSRNVLCSPLRIPKRRLSVSDSQPTPKRPCLPPAVGPRKQAVSTPIPITHQITPVLDEWFPFELPDTSLSVELFNWDVVVENDAFLYNSLFDNILQSDGHVFSNVTPPSVDAYESPAPLDLGVSSAVDPSVLDISSVFVELSPTQLTAPISTPPGPITATTTPVLDFLDAFLSAVNAESHITQSSSSLSTELSLNDTINLFGESVAIP